VRVSGSLVTEGKEDEAEIHEQERLGQAHDECPTDVHISGMEAVNAEAIERYNLLGRVVKPDISDGERGG